MAGRPDFLYVADSKLCSRENMDYIDRRAGRFVTVLPRSRLEDGEFRKWIQTHEPEWEKVWDRPNPRRKGGPRDRWYVCRAPLPSREAWPVTWVFSTLLALRQEQSRRAGRAVGSEGTPPQSEVAPAQGFRGRPEGRGDSPAPSAGPLSPRPAPATGRAHLPAVAPRTARIPDALPQDHAPALGSGVEAGAGGDRLRPEE